MQSRGENPLILVISTFVVQFELRTYSGGEFGWGGTSVIVQHRCPKVSSVRTEISRRLKGEKLTWFWFSVRIQTAKAWPIDPLDLMSVSFPSLLRGKIPVKRCLARGVRKVTTGITGLWQPSVHSDVAFWFFDVGSSYHCAAADAKCRIVHPPTGNVSWV